MAKKDSRNPLDSWSEALCEVSLKFKITLKSGLASEDHHHKLAVCATTELKP